MCNPDAFDMIAALLGEIQVDLGTLLDQCNAGFGTAIGFPSGGGAQLCVGKALPAAGAIPDTTDRSVRRVRPRGTP